MGDTFINKKKDTFVDKTEYACIDKAKDTFINKLERLNWKINLIATRFNGSHVLKKAGMTWPWRHSSVKRLKFDNCTWDVNCRISEAGNTADAGDTGDTGYAADARNTGNAADIEAVFRLTDGISGEMNLEAGISINNWSVDNYLMIPGAVYNGNRFEKRKLEYPPLISNEDASPDIPTIVSDIPGLKTGSGKSEIIFKTGDAATPAVGFYSPGTQLGFFMLLNQYNEIGDYSFSIKENKDRTRASLAVSSPCVRPDYKYTICSTKAVSPDKGTVFHAGDTVSIRFRLYIFPCRSIQNLFDCFINIRKDLTGDPLFCHQIPFSSAWGIQEDKYNKLNWEEKHGYYSVGHRENMYQNWQTGWVGGMMATYPLFFEGSELSRARVLKNFKFFFTYGLSRSGFFGSISDGDKWYSDSFRDPVNEKWHLIRKSSDALYYIIKQFMLFKQSDIDFKIPQKWDEGTRNCADAFVRLWDRYGQFGQFINPETGDMIVGNSCSAGIAPAGLALAYEYFGDEKYLRVAIEAARYYYDNFTMKGYTTGGPGEALQCPDSESAFGLLESYVTLYEITKDKKWIDMAEDMAKQCATWCVSYDFRFPPGSTFGKLGMHTLGSVYANAQNKHAAPGICTHSGVSLFKLYRATKNPFYLKLSGEIAHNINQYISRNDRPIAGLGAGWINERVEMSDWLEPVGEIFDGSCWCEVSNMLTFVEVPGLYIQPDRAFVYAIDHIDTYIKRSDSREIAVAVSNPTGFGAVVKVFVENSGDMDTILGQNALWNCMKISLKPGEEKELVFKINMPV